MFTPKVLLIFEDRVLNDIISRAILQPAEVPFVAAAAMDEAYQKLNDFDPNVLILEDRLAGNEFEAVHALKTRSPAAAILLFSKENALEDILQAVHAGIFDVLTPPIKTNEVLQAVQRALNHHRALHEWASLKAQENTRALQQRVDELEALSGAGRSMTASLDLEDILALAIEAAVELTGAEEGSLMLVDEETGELHMRAAKNIGEAVVHTFRMHVGDSLADEVIHSGEPVRYSGREPQKIQSSLFVQSLIYVPLRGPRGVIGVLGVDNRINKEPFGENHLALMTRIAAYTAIALENARLFANTEIERRKLNAILTKVVDGIIVVDHNQNMVLMNPTAREAFGVSSRYLAGSPIKDLVASTDLLEILNQNENMYPFQREVELEDGRVFNVQATVIPEVGIALTMQDMTQIKELDRIKSDFVSTVSHDLRSPLTAILGYVELLDRVGPLTDMQREFVERVHVSVQSITTLINELLDLSRIEAGFDTQKEFFSIEAIIDATVEELRESADTKNQVITQEVPPDLPPIFASPSRIQQVLANLVGNAIKYTQETGEVKIIARTEADQLILQICDDGPGILPAEQPFVFDRFFRASNVGETDGTGLGLAIVKSIVENHHGRTWVESVPGQGSTFTVVLPLLPPNETPPLSEIQSKNQA